MIATVRFLVLWAPVAIYMATIFLVSADSDPPAPSSFSDKTLHLLAYAALGVLVCRAAAGGLGRRVTVRAALITMILSIGYGVTDEIHQMFVPLRSPELLDVFADAAGATLGLIGCWAWGILRVSNPKSQTPNPQSH
jgi:VanZ family protein